MFIYCVSSTVVNQVFFYKNIINNNYNNDKIHFFSISALLLVQKKSSHVNRMILIKIQCLVFGRLG